MVGMQPCDYRGGRMTNRVFDLTIFLRGTVRREKKINFL